MRGDRVPYTLPRHHGARSNEDLAGVLEGVGLSEAVLQRNSHALELDVRLPDGALAHLAGHDLRGEAFRTLLDEEPGDVVFVVAGPYDGDVGEGGVADPALLSVYDVPVTLTTRLSLEPTTSEPCLASVRPKAPIFSILAIG